MRRLLIILSVLSGITLYVLAVATGNTNKLNEYFWFILIFSCVLIFSLLFMLMQQLWSLRKDLKHNVYGAQLSKRLIKRFSFVAILPGLFLFAVSIQFISHTINSWFTADTSAALERSLSLAKHTLSVAQDQAVVDASAIQLRVIHGQAVGKPLDVIMEGISHDLGGFEQIGIFNLKTKRYVVGKTIDAKLNWPNNEDLNAFILGNQSVAKNSITENNQLFSIVFLKLPRVDENNYVIFFRKSVPQDIAKNVVLIENAKAKYSELTYYKEAIRTFFVITLVVAMLLSIVVAILGAVFFSRRFVAPLAALSDSTSAIAKGDFSKRNPIYQPDELGLLMQNFNSMIDQLQAAKESNEILYKEQEDARFYLESVLLSLTTGVITIDKEGLIKTFNERVESILNVSLTPLLGIPWYKWHCEDMHIELLGLFIRKMIEESSFQNPIEFEYNANDQVQILLGRATSFLNDNGVVLVFDDITKMVSAQKEAAWGEVARRLAHEIRNPLTPIQLSAERMLMKLEPKLNEEDAFILKKSSDTIVKQVMALKEMVESFRNYAKSASLNLEITDLNDLIKEVLVLYEGLHCTFVDKLITIAIKVKIDKTAMRQVLHNVLKNAYEAAEANMHPEVIIETRVDAGKAILLIKNNGKSFNQQILQKVFEPYVTDKDGGTGLGLAVVKKIIDEHSGQILLGNNEHQEGSWVEIILEIAGS